MKDKDFIEKIHKIYSKKLKNINVKNNKLWICFSGVPGSGKSFISKKIAKRYNGVIIRGDDIRKIIDGFKVSEHFKEHLLDKYLLWFISNYFFINKLIILDKSIDRDFRKIFSLARRKKYKVFVIRIKASSKIVKVRLSKQERIGKGFNTKMKKWSNDWKRFGKEVKSDIIIENSKKLNLKPLFDKLDKIIKSSF